MTDRIFRIADAYAKELIAKGVKRIQLVATHAAHLRKELGRPQTAQEMDMFIRHVRMKIENQP